MVLLEIRSETYAVVAVKKTTRLLFVSLLALNALGLARAQDNASTAEPESAHTVFERRIAERATKALERLQLSDDAVTAKAQKAITQFYRGLNAAHTDRDQHLALLSTIDPGNLHRILHRAEKRAQAVYGELIGSLVPLLNDAQIEAVKDGMTFDMVPLSMATFERMFPRLDERQKAQVRAWLVESREISLVAGSAERKLDIFRINKMRTHAYLAAQGFDVDAAVKAEEARKAAAKKND